MLGCRRNLVRPREVLSIDTSHAGRVSRHGLKADRQKSFGASAVHSVAFMRRAHLASREGLGHRRWLGSVLVFVVIAGSTVAPAAVGSAEPTLAPPVVDPWIAFSRGWTELPVPPETRSGASIVWTDRELILWGGASVSGAGTTDGFAFDPSSMTWRQIPPAPITARYGAQATWTGSQVLIWGGYDERRRFVDGASFDPITSSWRRIAKAPIKPRWGGVAVWTGTELIVWGGGQPGKIANIDGAAYDPAADSWRRVADSPIGLNLATGAWTGTEMIVFGSLLNRFNRAPTRRAVGAAYDPVADSWKELPASPLSPQASSGGWVADRFIAWDYTMRAARYSPRSDSWKILSRPPMSPSECYPDGAVFDGGLFAFDCGRAAVFDAISRTWYQARSRFQIPGPRPYEFTTGEAVGAGMGVVILEHEITTSNGEPCIGCSGSGTHLWVFLPFDGQSPTAGLRYTRGNARTVATNFMNLRIGIGRPVREMHAVISRSGRRWFGSPTSGSHPLYDPNYVRYRVLFVRRSAHSAGRVSFDAAVRMFVKHGRSFTESLTIGTGRSIDGRDLDLVVNGGHAGP